MASTVYTSSNISSAIGLNTSPEIAVSGGAEVQEAIDSVVANMYLSTTAYSVTYSVTIKVVYSGGYATKTQNVKLDSSNYTGATVNFAMPAMTAAQCNSITSIIAYCSDGRIFVKSIQYVTINYTIVTACGATTLSVDNATPGPGETVTLSGGGTAGTNNAITGYKIYRSINNGASFSYLQTVTTAATTFSVGSVEVPGTVGESYQFVSVTVGSRTGYDSEQSNAVEVTTVSAYCTAPTVLTLSALITAINPSLAWAGAAPGSGGNTITEYEIQYADSADGTTWGAWTALKTVASTANSGSTLVDINATLGNYRRYRIKTHGALGVDYYSEWSAASESVQTSSSTVSNEPPQLIVYEYPHLIYSIPDYNGEYPIQYGPYPLGMVGGYGTMIIRRLYWGVSTLSLSIPFNAAANALLIAGNLIGVAGRKEQYRIVNKNIKLQKTGVETIEITAWSMLCLLGKRQITYSTLGEGKPVVLIKSLLRNQPIFYETYTAWLGDYEPDTFCVAEDGDRRFPSFNWLAPAFDVDASAAISFQPELLTSVLDSFISLCKIEGCGAKVTGEYQSDIDNTLTLGLQLYKGADRSVSQDVNPHVVFSEQLCNVLTQTYEHSIDGVKTAGYATSTVLDSVLADDKRLVDIMSDNAYSAGDQAYINGGGNPPGTNGGSGVDRDEIGMAVTDITAPTSGTTDEQAQIIYLACKQLGRNEIAKAIATHLLNVSLDTGVGPQYGIDYDLGDIVTATSPRYGISMNVRITEATETYEPGKKMKVELAIGDPEITLIGRIKQIVRRG